MDGVKPAAANHAISFQTASLVEFRESDIYLFIFYLKKSLCVSLLNKLCERSQSDQYQEPFGTS